MREVIRPPKQIESFKHISFYKRNRASEIEVLGGIPNIYKEEQSEITETPKLYEHFNYMPFMNPQFKIN